VLICSSYSLQKENMRKLLLVLLTVVSSTSAFAQMGTATDFTITDIEGNTHHLYDILDQGYVVVLDASATWCGTCWSVHQNHTLNDLNTQKGPNGTNEVRVIFYEADASTTTADLNGTGSNTYGDWVTGTNFPIVDESSPLSLNGSVYWPLGFPTISVIRPGDREIIADVWNQSLAGMVSAVDNAIATDPASIGSDFITENGITSYPNPTVDMLNVNLGSVADQIDGLSVRNIMGQEVMNISTSGQTLVKLSMEFLTSGAYILEFSFKGSVLGVQKIMKD
jgi:hypothetical protein